MTKPKISPDQAQKLLKVVRYTLDMHEWCEYPSYYDTRCGERHSSIGCSEIPKKFVSKEIGEPAPVPCEGCKAREKAEAAAKWKAATE